MTLPEKQLVLARAWLEKAEGDLETARASPDRHASAYSAPLR
jgi:hypothetical protein